jgi:hypothetical protein
MHQRPRLRVERAEGLVHQQDHGINGERARDRHALLHAARELRGKAVLEAFEMDKLDQFPRPVLADGARQPLLLEAVKDVLPYRLPGIKREALEDDAAVGAGAGDRLAGDRDGAGLHRQEAPEQIEQRALAAAARAQQRQELALLDLERNALERQHRLAAGRAISVAHLAEGDSGFHHSGAKRLTGAASPPPRQGTGRSIWRRRS